MGRVVVVGAGAAGLTAAIFAAKQGAKVILLERTKEAGKKILMSGGARCNVLPVAIDIQKDYFSSDMNLMKNIFATWNLPQCHNWISSQVGLEMVKEEETNNQSSKEVRDKLLQKCLAEGVEVKYLWKVDELKQSESGWICKGTHQESPDEITADRVVISTGGLSFPLVGTDGVGHNIAASLGHEMIPTFPALTPLRGPHPGRLSMHTNNNNAKQATANRSGFVFTHHGYSGPAILDLSHFAVQALENGSPEPQLKLNWADMTVKEWEDTLSVIDFGRELVVNRIARHLPSRLATAICYDLRIRDLRVADIDKVTRRKLIDYLVSYQLPYTGHDGYKKAEVTGGGVRLSDIHTQSCESKRVPKLYFCGEILDVFGRIGGFNFYWAWVSGRLAGVSAAKSIENSNKQEQR